MSSEEIYEDEGHLKLYKDLIYNYCKIFEKRLRENKDSVVFFRGSDEECRQVSMFIDKLKRVA